MGQKATEIAKGKSVRILHGSSLCILGTLTLTARQEKLKVAESCMVAACIYWEHLL